MTNLSSATWRTSSYSSSNGGQCVEVARYLPGIVAVRDSKDQSGQVLTFTAAEWRAFVGGARDGEFDLDESGQLP